MTKCDHVFMWEAECDCPECLACPDGSRATMCGRCLVHKTNCENCDETFVPDEDETVCRNCVAFEFQEYRNEYPDNWGFAYINKMGGWER